MNIIKLRRYITEKLKWNIFTQSYSKYRWKKLNRHNFTTIAFDVDPDRVTVGNGTYGKLTVYNNGTDNRLKIGHYCSIGDNVTFLLGTDHEMDHISTYPFKVMYMGEENESVSKGDIIVDDDVWIGHGSIILSGVHIGQGAVIAAGAVVSRDVPPYAIAGGVPAKVIKYRFNHDIIRELLKLDYSKVDADWIKGHISELYEEVKDSDCLTWI